MYVPAGKYVTGPIELESNLVLYIDAGAVVRFPAARLPFTPGRQQSIEALTPVPLVGGRNLENNRTPAFRNIAVSNMTIHNARVAIDIEGLPEMPIEGLRLTSIVASSQVGMKASYTVALELRDVRVDADAGPAFLARDSAQMRLDNVSTRTPRPDSPVIRLERCQGAILRASRAFPGTGTFLSVAPGELKGIFLEGNTLLGARKAAEERRADFWRTEEPPTEHEPPAGQPARK